MNLQFSPSSGQARFVNLRHAQNGLAAVGQLASITVDPKSKLLLSIGDLDILYSSGNLVAANHQSGTVTTFDEIDSEPRCAIQLSTNSFTMFLNDRRVSYLIDEDGAIARHDSPDVQPFSVVASPLSTVSVRIPATSLSRKYSASEVWLDPTDVKRVSSAFLTSVTDATTSAWSCSRFVAPTIARCRVVDETEQTLFVGPPVLVNPLGNGDLTPTAGWSVSSEFDSLSQSTVDIDSFGLQLKTFAGIASPGLSVIVEVINLSLIDFDATARCVISRNSSGNASLAVTAPLLTGNGEIERMVSAMLSSGDDLFVPFARVENPFDGTEKLMTLIPDKPFIAASSPGAISRLFKQRLELSTFTELAAAESVGLPHRFIPTVAAKNGSAILYANPDVLFFDGYAPPFFVGATSGRTGQWKATATVEFDDGESIGVASVEATGDVPVILSPVISYPSRRAVAIAIEVEIIDGAVWRRRFELTPMSGRDMAIFVNDGLQPIDLTRFVGTQSTPAESNPPRLLMKGTIVTASSDNPFQPIDVTTDGNSEILAIAPVVCSPRGLEQRRNRFYLFDSEGVKLTTLNDARKITNIVLTDRRGIKSPDCVAIDSNGRVVALTKSGHLLALSGASSVTLDRVDGRAIVADNIKDELWILTESPDHVIVRDMTAGDYYRRLIANRIAEVLNTSVSSSILIDNRLMRLGHELSSESVKIEATVKVDGISGTKMKLPAMFLFKLGSGHADAGLVTAAPDDLLGNSRGGSIRSKLFSGVVGREIALPVNFYPAESYTAHVEAKVLPGSVFGGVKILYKR